MHLPNLDRVQADLAAVAMEAKGLSGGDILNVCVNSIYAGSTAEDPARWKVTAAMLLKEIGQVRKAKSDHAGKNGSKAASHRIRQP